MICVFSFLLDGDSRLSLGTLGFGYSSIASACVRMSVIKKDFLSLWPFWLNRFITCMNLGL